MPDPLVSVVIPAYRSGRLLWDAISSVMAQTLKDLEIILIDNNADEETKSIINQAIVTFPNKIRAIHEATQGNCSARNRGILESRGQYIALLDDDDKMHPERLKIQVDLAKNNPKASIIYALMDVCSYEGDQIIFTGISPTVEFYVKPVMQKHPRYKSDPPLLIMPSVMLFSKEMAIKAGCFDIQFNPCHTEDTDFYFRMWHLGPFIGVDQSLTIYRQASPEFLARKRKGMINWFQARKNQALFLRKMAQQYGEIAKDGFKEAQSQLLRETAQNILRYPDGKLVARRMLKRAIRAQTFDLKNWKWFLRTFYSSSFLSKALKQEFLESSLSKDVSNLSLLNSLYDLRTDREL